MTARSGARTLTVTGASGLLGRHLCNHFRSRGWEVRGLVRNPTAYPFREPGVQLFRCELPQLLEERALTGADVLIHCAYTTRFQDIEAARRVNEEGTERVLRAARAAGVRRFVFVSSTAAHPEARSYYGQSKQVLENRCDPDRDLILRPGLVLAADGGLYQRMRQTLRRLPVVPLLGGGRQVVQTVYVEDFCTAVERALALELTGTLTVAEPEGIALRELLRLTARYLGTPLRVVPVPFAPVYLALRTVEALRLPFPVSSENLLGLVAMRPMPSKADLARLGLRLRSAAESLAELQGRGKSEEERVNPAPLPSSAQGEATGQKLS